MSPILGKFNDGQTAAQQAVTLRVEGDWLLIESEAHELTRWPCGSVRLRDGEAQTARSGIAVLICEGAQIRLASLEALAALRPDLPNLTRATAKLRRERRATVKWLGGIVATLAALYLILPYVAVLAAGLVPLSWQRSLGARAEADLIGTLNAGKSTSPCADSTNSDFLFLSAKAFAKAASLPEAPQIRVYPIKLPNAFALPGNRIILTRGMLERMKTADQALGVLAHETAHLAHSDPLASMIQHQGWGLAAQVMFGTGMVSSLAQVVPIFAYHRDLERRADAEGGRYMAALGRSPQALADALHRLAEGDSGGWLSTHPATEERAAAIAALPGPERDTVPLLLRPGEWQSLRKRCGLSP